MRVQTRDLITKCKRNMWNVGDKTNSNGITDCVNMNNLVYADCSNLIYNNNLLQSNWICNKLEEKKKYITKMKKKRKNCLFLLRLFCAYLYWLCVWFIVDQQNDRSFWEWNSIRRRNYSRKTKIYANCFFFSRELPIVDWLVHRLTKIFTNRKGNSCMCKWWTMQWDAPLRLNMHLVHRNETNRNDGDKKTWPSIAIEVKFLWIFNLLGQYSIWCVRVCVCVCLCMCHVPWTNTYKKKIPTCHHRINWMGRGILMWVSMVSSLILSWMVFYYFSCQWTIYSILGVCVALQCSLDVGPSARAVRIAQAALAAQAVHAVQAHQLALVLAFARAPALEWAHSNWPPVAFWLTFLEFDWLSPIPYPFGELYKFAFFCAKIS